MGSSMKGLMRGAKEQWDLGSCHARRQRRAQQPRRASACLDHLPQIEGRNSVRAGRKPVYHTPACSAA